MSSIFKKIGMPLGVFLLTAVVAGVYAQAPISKFKIDASGLPILSFGTLLTFLVRMIFIVAGLAALLYGLLGGLAWVTSGGGKDEIKAARDKIQAAVVGIFVIIVVLTILWTLETVVFNRSICFGISCDIKIPGLGITPLPAESCQQYCQNIAGGKYNLGYCAVDAGVCRAGNPATRTSPGDPVSVALPDKVECGIPAGTPTQCCCTP